MSYERYNDNVKRNRPVGEEALLPLPAKPETADTADSAKTADGNTVAMPAAQTASAIPTVAAPTRPLDLPALPGLNRDFSIKVSSTLDQDAEVPKAQVVENKDGDSDLHLQEQNWQEAAEIARQHAEEANGTMNDEEHIPLNVRMSYLPDPKIVPEPGDDRKKRARLPSYVAAAKPPAAIHTSQPQAQPAECAAIDNYKKQQLAAIQSDRQTLNALQSAIADLGLQKQLDFIAGAQQSQTLNGQLPASSTLNVTAPSNAPVSN